MTKKKKQQQQIPFRLNLLFLIVFLLFSSLIVQLGGVQILGGEEAQNEIDRTVQDKIELPVPRGKIYDRNHNEVVANQPVRSITYTPAKGVQAKDRLEVAKSLSKFISMEIEGITERDKKEYWYLLNTKKANNRLTTKEKEESDDGKRYNNTLDKITEDEISGFSDKEKVIIAIKKELDRAMTLTPQIVKNEEVTEKEYAEVSAHLGEELPGINATIDWKRNYPLDNGTFRNLVGSITDQGIPADNQDYYLTRGYSRNDRVGKSGLEKHYESYLRGRKEVIEYTTDKSGDVIGQETIVDGKAGKDLVLTIDMDFQREVDQIVQEELNAIIKSNPYQHRFLKDAIAVVMNPGTGELLAVSGQSYDSENDQFKDTSFKTLYDAHLPGSSVKGATVLAGYNSGAIYPGQVFLDRPIKIGADSRGKSSYRNLGSVNDYDALRLSSNVYMFYIALRMGGIMKHPFPDGDSAPIDIAAWQEMRNYFDQFGLGAATGIDYPYESNGVTGTEVLPGLLMDFAIGQYDSFTTMQLAQYVSTIANDGYRVKPHFVKEIRDPNPVKGELGPIDEYIKPEVLNKIQMDQSNIDRVQEGFRKVFQVDGGTGYKYFGNSDYLKYNAAGKTGTAENSKWENGRLQANTENLSLVGYAPYDDPEIAFAIIVPHTGIVRNRYPVNHRIGQRILDAYFE
ncbi:peptidoglycan D,D-transpeptidase FtsI family protein [Aquibacillus saliphilus]|uniref:peptidoglycan D,D-transpeptidase FtsI family protein n=1 Tax=Aquibacillus saliphilus TaxID=1909422 RepID=UPI001CF031C6|nr:penicillin-binding protein 2 [Aquibacillus saliphilus]